jgi:hypothetical protein
MRLLSDFFGPHICGNLKGTFNITYVEQAQAMTDKQLLLARGMGLKVIERLRAIPPDGDAPVNYLKLPVNLWTGTLIYAIEQLPNNTDGNEHRVKVVQDGMPMELIFHKEPKHYWKWMLVAVQTFKE